MVGPSWKAWLLAAAIPAALVLALGLIPQVFYAYGIAFFILGPFLQAVAASLILGYRQPITFKACASVATLSVSITVLALILMRFEGLLCVAMASPLLFLGIGLGAWVASTIIRQRHERSPSRMLVSTLLLIPGLLLMERAAGPPRYDRVLTSVTEIDAPPEKVWPYVLSLPEVRAKRSWLLRTGVAYPVSTQTFAPEVGAARECRLSTGVMSEQVTAVEKGRILRFKVLDTPESMKETNPFGPVHAMHLRGYYVCDEGEFKLEALPGGRTRLTGTSWYHHRFGPGWYWSLWTDAVVEDVHQLVFDEIKARSVK